MKIELEPIGVIHTPYTDWAPNQPPAREVPSGTFRIVLDKDQAPGLVELERFSHLIVLSFLERSERDGARLVKPPWAKGREVGLFASRSPNRPNPIGLSVVELLGVEGTTLDISPIDLFDGSPVLDIKPYIPALDARTEASSGWIEDFEDHQHMMQHLRGVPHDHEHDHDHGHDHGHGHGHQ